MSLIGDLRKKAEAAIKKTAEEINKHIGQSIELNICMMGPRAVGKTTILTSIFHEADKAFGSSDLKFMPTDATKAVINKGREDLESIFNNYKDETDAPLPGINASKGVTHFHFDIGLKGKNKSADVNIVDFPGEFVDENHLEHSQVVEFVKKSHIIFVAVDSVYLMEEEGKYNEIRNRSKYMCEKICSLLKQIDQKERKLIMFVPLKCEKYCVEHRIDEVTNEVINQYSVLIKEVSDNYKDRIGIAITPIQTLGGVVFDKFVKGADGNFVYDEDGVTPKIQFKFYSQIIGRAPMYIPAFCVQPLYYLIAFALSQYKSNKDRGGVIGSIFTGISGLFSSDLVFYEACQSFANNIKTRGNGFRLINNPNFFKQ